MKRGLLLVDIQNDYFTGGAMQLVGMEAAAGKANALLQVFPGAFRTRLSRPASLETGRRNILHP